MPRSRTAAPPARLKAYREKRRFDRTPEPAGGALRRTRGGRSFVVQKHAASRLHYDFRLEHDGALLSWAVPKGPSLNPGERRLAIRTEDHPLEYGRFEGIIPEGEYGGGAVIVWDRGRWAPEGDPEEALRRGRLTFTLDGKRLRGRFHLVRTRGGDRSESWLLFKGRDGDARAGKRIAGKRILDEDTSVLSGRTLEEVVAAPGRVWHSRERAHRGGRAPRRARAEARRSGGADLTALIEALPDRLPRGIALTNLDKVLYPDQGLTKAALVAYYAAVAERMVPLIAGRPLTLVRCPEGRHRQCFYQRHAKRGVPDAVRRVPIREESGAEAVHMAIEDLEGLISLVQLGVLEIHTWNCRRDRVDRPDQIVFDLDPGEGIAWSQVADAAFELKALLEELDLTSFVKTTGGKGLHVTVPIARRAGWDQVKELAHAVALAMAARRPERYAAVMSKARRVGRIYVDYLRNALGASAIAPYSTRAREGALVAAPVTWDELASGVEPARFTVTTMPARLARQRRDPWHGYDRVRQAITAAMIRERKRRRS